MASTEFEKRVIKGFGSNHEFLSAISKELMRLIENLEKIEKGKGAGSNGKD